MASFKLAYPIIKDSEGGYVNDSLDSGGETYAGISRKWNPNWLGWLIIDKAKRDVSFKNSLKSNQYLENLVEEFYKEKYWDKIKGDMITSQKIANVIIDFGINAGISIAVKMAQKISGTVQDGVIGVNTLQSFEKISESEFLNKYADLRIDYYNDIVIRRPDQARFLTGWINRANKFRS